jgi:hypothetical protein
MMLRGRASSGLGNGKFADPSVPPPPPPPSMIAVSSFEPSLEQFQHGALYVRAGDHFFKMPTTIWSDPSGAWVGVRHIGQHLVDHEPGWVLRDILEDVRASPTLVGKHKVDKIAPPDFTPLLGTWSECMELLKSISGDWKDDRNSPKTYCVTVMADGSANVLTVMRGGGHRMRTKLVRIQKILNGMYAILWSNTFCLMTGASSKGIEWVPIVVGHSAPWSWTRILG